jgi:hypothetical protein
MAKDVGLQCSPDLTLIRIARGIYKSQKFKKIQLKMDSSKNIYFNLDLVLTKCIRIISCKRFLSRKCCFRRFFNKKLRPSTYMWWCFCLFQPVDSHILYDFQATNSSAPGGAGTLTGSPLFFLLFTWES